MTTFRQTAWDLSPARLRTLSAARMVYAFIGLPLDTMAEAAKQALEARFPEVCADDALPYHGRDRGIKRGPAEPSASYRARLLLWISSWRSAGVGSGLLDQLAGFLVPQATRMRMLTQVGVRYERLATGVFSIAHFGSGVWDWDGATSLWARFWPIIDAIGGTPWKRDGTWGDGSLWGDDPDQTWGSTATLEQVQGIRGIVDEWRPAQSVCKNIIVSFDAALFNETTFADFPAGNWGHWSKNVAGSQVPARDARAIYFDGVS